MAKDPAFLFYPGDFNTGTQFFSDEQVGKYMRLLMAQHQHGHLSENQVLLICKSYDKDVMNKFVKDKNGLWFNQRLESEILKRKEYSISRSKNRTSKKEMSSSYVPHMENRNENEIKNGNTVKRSKSEISKELFSDEIYIADLQSAHKGKDIKQAFNECYTHHSSAPNPPNEIWEWRQKLNTWLTIKGESKNKLNGKSSTRTSDAIIEQGKDFGTFN